MHIYLKERIGNPELFTGRKKELEYFLNWIDRIKIEMSRSTALLSRRKTGKTSLLQRLYRNAPLLVSGSWVGWLIDDINRLLPGRFIKYPLESMPEHEAVETVLKYSLIGKTPVTEETAYLISQLTEGSPFYISTLFDSRYHGKDLATEEGVKEAQAFLEKSGELMKLEQIDKAVLFVFSVSGFHKTTLGYLKKHEIAWTCERRWLEKDY